MHNLTTFMCYLKCLKLHSSMVNWYSLKRFKINNWPVMVDWIVKHSARPIDYHWRCVATFYFDFPTDTHVFDTWLKYWIRVSTLLCQIKKNLCLLALNLKYVNHELSIEIFDRCLIIAKLSIPKFIYCVCQTILTILLCLIAVWLVGQ